MSTTKQTITENPPLCACGCGATMKWNPSKGWAKWVLGHHLRGKPSAKLGTTLTEDTKQKMSDKRILFYAKKNRLPRIAPEKEIPPLCACGCKNPVNWISGKGWSAWLRNHNRVGRPSWNSSNKPQTEHDMNPMDNIYKASCQGEGK